MFVAAKPALGLPEIKMQLERTMARAHQLTAIQNASHLREPSCSHSMARAAAAQEGTEQEKHGTNEHYNV